MGHPVFRGYISSPQKIGSRRTLGPFNGGVWTCIPGVRSHFWGVSILRVSWFTKSPQPRRGQWVVHELEFHTAEHCLGDKLKGAWERKLRQIWLGFLHLEDHPTTCKSFITMVGIRPLRWLLTPLDGELHQLGPNVALGSFFSWGEWKLPCQMLWITLPGSLAIENWLSQKRESSPSNHPFFEGRAAKVRGWLFWGPQNTLANYAGSKPLHWRALGDSLKHFLGNRIPKSDSLFPLESCEVVSQPQRHVLPIGSMKLVRYID